MYAHNESGPAEYPGYDFSIIHIGPMEFAQPLQWWRLAIIKKERHETLMQHHPLILDNPEVIADTNSIHLYSVPLAAGIILTIPKHTTKTVARCQSSSSESLLK